MLISLLIQHSKLKDKANYFWILTALLRFEFPQSKDLPPNQFPEIPAQDFNTDNDINDDISDMDFGFMLGVGASYAINSRHEIIADIRGSYGLIPLQKDTDTYGDVHMGTLVFSLGYAYTFDKIKKTVD